jgi:hypothetical protein
MALLYLFAFPASYLVEYAFICVTYLLSQVRNRLDIMKRDDLRITLTTWQPVIQKLSSSYQA